MAKDTKAPETPDAPAAPEGDSTEEFDHRAALLEGQNVEDESTEAPSTPDPDDTKTASDVPDPSPEVSPSSETTDAATGENVDDSPTAPSFLDQVRQLGYEGDDAEEASLALLETFRNMAGQYDDIQQQLQQLQGQQQQPQQPAAPETPEPTEPEHWWKPPEFSPEWFEKYREVTLDAAGNPQIGWKKDTPPEVQRNAQAYQDYVEQWADDLVRRPHEILPQIIRQEFDRYFDERYGAIEEERAVADFANTIREEHSNWMYTQDPRTGREVLTPEGQRISELIQEVGQMGVTNPQQQWELAVAKFDYERRLNQPPQTIQPPQEDGATTEDANEVAAKKRKNHLKKGASQGMQNRTGSVAPAELEPQRPQNPNLSPGEQLLQQLKQDGADI